ncbi:alpha/beta fold hydrolase [Mycetocola zhadangensis]|uniref:alpha/beta fold hydrolase n=1 Tax=Mycetocola zhadangensis TaxID=1164595 RepID=UPI003A4DA3B7
MSETPPTILLVHGFASSYRATWGEYGWAELLDDLGYTVVPFELPGHGNSTVLASSEEETLEALCSVLERNGIRVAMGFSAGSVLLLRAAHARPDLLDRLALLGLGDAMWGDGIHHLADRLLADHDSDEGELRLLRQIAAHAGNDLESVAAYARIAPTPPPFGALHTVTADVLVVLGDEDTVGPATRLIDSLPNADLVRLARTDHYRTASSPVAMQAVASFFS